MQKLVVALFSCFILVHRTVDSKTSSQLVNADTIERVVVQGGGGQVIVFKGGFVQSSMDIDETAEQLYQEIKACKK